MAVVAMQMICATSVFIDGDPLTLITQTDGDTYYVSPDVDSLGQPFSTLPAAMAFAERWIAAVGGSIEPGAPESSRLWDDDPVLSYALRPVERDLFACRLRNAAIPLLLESAVRRAYEADVPIARIAQLTGLREPDVNAMLDTASNLLRE
jgi:hypothetical protein